MNRQSRRYFAITRRLARHAAAGLPVGDNGPGWQPWTLKSSSQFRPGPLLTSAQYAADLNEAKARNSTTRTAEQTAAVVSAGPTETARTNFLVSHTCGAQSGAGVMP
jgi:hypothetical protein